jgi:hypothetical protein
LKVSTFSVKGRKYSMKRSINRERVRELHEAGASVTEIASQLGCGKAAISKILKSMRGAKGERAPAITDSRLLNLWQLFYDHLWKLKEQGFPGAPKKQLLDRLRLLISVVRE